MGGGGPIEPEDGGLAGLLCAIGVGVIIAGSYLLAKHVS